MVMWRERFLIAAVTAVCVLIAGMFLLVVTPIYTSTARMSVTQDTSPLARTQQASFSDATAGNYLYTEQKLMESPAVLSLALQMPEMKGFLKGLPTPIHALQTGMTVEVGKRDTVISVSFSSADRVAAATIANAIVKAYMQYQTKPKAAATAELDRLIDERRKVADKIDDETASMLKLERLYGVLAANNAQLGSLAERQLTELSQELHTAHLDLLKAQAEYDEAQESVKGTPAKDAELDPADSVPLGPDQKTVIQTQLMQLDAILQDLRRRYLPDHPQVQAAQHRIAQVRLMYAKAVERQYRIAQKRELDLQSEFDAQQKRAIDVSAALGQYLRLQADLENDRKTESQLDDRRRQIEIARDLGMLSIDPFEQAQPELKPSRPSRPLVLGIGLLVGLVFGSGAGFLRDWFDDRFRTIDEMRGTTGLQLLGIVPRMPEGLAPAMVGQQALLEPMSAVAEACRMIRTAIHFGTAKDRRRSVLITSPSNSEGKSTLASNLAITMAQAGKRVLLIDADLRLPTQHKIFGVDNDAGLSSLLQGRITLEQAVEPTEINGLELLPAGPGVHNPAEMLNSLVFTELMDMLFDRYDQLIIDSAPVVGISDSRIVAASCDVTVLVLRAGVSTRRMSELARQGLASVGAQVLGMVINDAAEGSAGSHPYVVLAGRPTMKRVTSQHLSDAEH
jgi:capsular exopolysaccharide synthesis family protein